MAEHDIVNTVKLAVRMMDNVIDVSNYPLDAQRQEAQHKRRIGLGITGLADALAMCGLHYGTPEACNTAAVWMKTINSVAYETSLSLAAEKGKFPAFSEKMGNAYYPERRNGQALRNGTLTSIAPTGTISLLAGNISSGIEPMYDWEYERKVKQPDGSMKSVEVEDFAVRLYRQKFSGKPLPSQFWARAHDLSPRQHLNMQAALQRYVDSSISKTVNCPEDMSFADFEQLYLEAYDMGLKACAAFRPNAITGSILSTGGGGRSPEVHAAPFKEELIVGKDFMEGENQRARYRLAEGPMVELTTPGGGLTATGKKELIELVNKAAGSPFVITPREPVMKGRTHKIKWGAHAIYITINDREDGTPYEIFINSKHSEHYAWSVALTRMISAVWRLHPGDTGFIIEELKAIHDPRGGAWMGGRYIPSVQAAMGYVIDAHLNGKDNGFELHPEVPETDPSTLLNFPHWGSCPGCGSANVYFPKRGCLTCRDCGFSNCNE
jgi:ribonucleoside-diphosphate reductase alpha chain